MLKLNGIQLRSIEWEEKRAKEEANGEQRASMRIEDVELGCE